MTRLASGSRRPWTARGLLGALLLFALALRVVGLGAYAREEYFYDEMLVVATASRIAFEGEFRPETHYWPTGGPYLTGLWTRAARSALAPLESRLGRPLLELRTHKRLPPDLFVLTRALAALLGTLTVALTFLIGRSIGGVAMGLCAGLALAVAPLHIQKSQEAVLDAPLVFWVTLAFWLALQAAERRRAWLWGAAGLAAGIGAATKYTGALVAIGIAALALARLPPKTALRTLGLVGLASLAGFGLANPEAWLEPSSTWHGFRALQGAYDTKGLRAGNSHAALFPHALRVGRDQLFGGAYLALAGLGLLLSLRRVRDPLFAVALFASAYVAIYNLTQIHAPSQNYLPAAPFTALLGAAPLVELGRSLARPRARGALAVAYLLVALAVPTAAAVEHQLARRWPQAGHQAWDWLVDWALTGSRVVADRALAGDSTVGRFSIRETTGLAGRDLVESDYIVARASDVCPRGEPAGYPALRRPDWVPARVVPAGGWARRGESLVIFERVRAALEDGVALDLRPLMPGDFELRGDASAEASLLALKSASSASWAWPEPGSSGERALVRLRGGGDASGRQTEGPLRLRLGLGEVEAELEIQENRLLDYGWVEVGPAAPGSTLTLAYAGPPGGRIYFTIVAALRVGPAGHPELGIEERAKRLCGRLGKAAPDVPASRLPR